MQKRTKKGADGEPGGSIRDFYVREAPAEPQFSLTHTPLNSHPYTATEPAATLDSRPTIESGTQCVTPKSLMIDNSTLAPSDLVFGNPLETFGFDPFAPFTSPWPSDKGLPVGTQSPFEEHYDGQACVPGEPGAVIAQHVAALRPDRNSARTLRVSRSTPNSIKGKSTYAAPGSNTKRTLVPSRGMPAKPVRILSSQHTSNGTAEDSTGRLFTCPFVWSDPMRHRGCLKLKLRRIRDVKQHLHRSHEQPLFCRRCKTIFKDDAEAQKHSDNVVPCHLQMQGTVPDGVTEAQFKRMGKSQKDLVTQWNSIWDAIFPDSVQAKPVSPFLDERLSEEIRALVVFSQTRGQQILQTNTSLTIDNVQLVLSGFQVVVNAWISGHANSASHP